MNRRLLLIILALLTAMLACNKPAGQQSAAPEAGISVEQAIQMTLTAVALQAPAQQPPQQPAQPQQPPAQQPPQQPAQPPQQPAIPSTEAPTLTPSPTPSITSTATPATPMVSVSVNTNCRTGPGKIYKLVGALLVGEQTEIVARDPSGLYWYVRNPDRPGEFCWLWGQYASTTGDTGSLPVFTPPPTPTFTPTPSPTPTPAPTFTVAYSNVDTCAGWFIEFQITNTGGAMFQSYTISVTDTVTSETKSFSAEKFEDWNGCTSAGGYEDLDPGDSGFATSGTLSNDPSGHAINATVTLCTEPSQAGTCITQSLSFTP